MKLQKHIQTPEALGKRRYHDACGAAYALDLVGERWALLVIRELMLGPRRFSDLRAALPGISANILTQRLEGLEAIRVLTRRKLPPPAPAWVYELTPWGYEAEPILQALGRWAVRSPGHDPTLPIGPVSILLSFRAMLDVNRARGFSATVGFRFGEEEYVGRLSLGTFAIRRGNAEDGNPMFDTDPETLAAVIYGGFPIEEAEATGALRLTGDRGNAHRFVSLFSLPEKVAPVIP